MRFNRTDDANQIIVAPSINTCAWSSDYFPLDAVEPRYKWCAGVSSTNELQLMN